MLNESSYHMAIYCYTAAAGVMLVYLTWWLSRHWTWTWVALAVLVAAALLLTPAYPRAGATTLAPALVVAAFQFMTDGPAAAMQTLRPVALLGGVAVLLVLLIRFAVFRGKPARGETRSRPVDDQLSAGNDRLPGRIEAAAGDPEPGAAV